MEIPETALIQPETDDMPAAQRAAVTAPDSDPACSEYQERRRQHWERAAARTGRGPAASYHRRLAQVFGSVVQPGQRVLEIGCGQGDLLAALRPAYGLGVDFSPAMLARARERHGDLHFLLADGHDLSLPGERFDAIILSDLLNDAWDVQALLENLRPLVHPGTRLIINTYSRMWELPLAAAEKLGLAQPVLYQNWLTVDDIRNMLQVSGFETIRAWQEVLLPLPLPLLAGFANRFLVRFWPFTQMALTNFILARPAPHSGPLSGGKKSLLHQPGVSVIVPARNEAGNIERIFASVPQMGRGTELIFVEGHSRDDTYAAIEEAMVRHPEVRARLFRQQGSGKGDAVRLGFAEASEEVLMILDADLTVPPHYLPRFYDALVSGRGDFVNGVRLVYPMEKQAMRFLNLLGNKFFSLLFTWLLGQPVKDTLCGTKVLWKKDYQRIADNRAFFGDFDPFGDFDLLFGAARLGMKIVDMPVRYRDRTYGTTNISRFRHGALLLKMAAIAARRLKFV